MIKLIFSDGKCAGYATVGYDSSDKDEKIVEKPKEDLNKMLPDSLDGGWKTHSRGYVLESGNVSFSESYDPDANDPTGGS